VLGEGDYLVMNFVFAEEKNYVSKLLFLIRLKVNAPSAVSGFASFLTEQLAVAVMP
jgi:hypothetical protein